MTKPKSNDSQSPMAILRQLIGLAYTYTDKELFYHKFRECIHITSLKRTGVLDVENHIPEISSRSKLSDAETEIYCLMQLGFTPQEMAVVCGEKSINAIYIKRHRLKKKLKGEASPEAVWFLLILCVIAQLILLLTHLPG